MQPTHTAATHTHTHGQSPLNENQTHAYVPNQLESPRVHSFTHKPQLRD